MNKVLKQSAGCFVLCRNSDQCDVLLQKKDWGDGKIGYVPPKGGVEENETLEETAIRETKEETGLQDIQILNLLGDLVYEYEEGTNHIKKIVTWFLATTSNSNLLDKNLTQQEISTQKEVLWVDINEALKLMMFEDECVLLRQAYDAFENYSCK